MDDFDPLAAVTHRDPYPSYARLVAERPFYDDPRAAMWVGSSAAVVEAILADAALRVRPSSEPIPGAMIDTALGDVYGRLARFCDGDPHVRRKHVIATALEAFDLYAVHETSTTCARTLIARWTAQPNASDLSGYLLGLSAAAIATLLGFPHSAIADATHDAALLARAFAPGGDGASIQAGIAATQALCAQLRAIDVAGSGDAAAALMFLNAARSAKLDEGDIVANLTGLFFQAHDATAALMGNTIAALSGANNAVTDRVRRSGDDLERFIGEVGRYDAPVQNTRRFAAADTIIADRRVRKGDTVLAIVAAANRDPAVNAFPGMFDIDRVGARSLTFGSGPHVCPAESLATTIARAGIAVLLDAGFDPRSYRVDAYRASANTRIPQFLRADGVE